MSNRKLINSEINFKTFMLILWEEKILILGMCLFFSTASFFYQSSKINKSEQKIISVLQKIMIKRILSLSVLYFKSTLSVHFDCYLLNF